MKKFLPLSLIYANLLSANPAHPTIVTGNAEFSTPSASELEVILSDKAIIDWESFSIEKGESAYFKLPAETASALQRVLGKEISEIDGLLRSNGQLYLINPNGIIIGPDGVIETADFIGSTLDIDNETFLKGKEILFQGIQSGAITHYGTIKASNGSIALIGLKVENRGVLEAAQSTALASGERILLKPDGEQRIFIEAPISCTNRETGILNSGEIRALQVELKSAGTPYTYAIRHEGTIEATSKHTDEAGRVFLVSKTGKIETDGSIFAPGGEIHLVGDRTHVSSSSALSTASSEGGGAIFIGFDAENGSHGRGTWVSEGAQICADALQIGEGGEIRIFGDQIATCYGNVTACGGEKGGNGGFIDLSAAWVDFSPKISTAAPKGVVGEFRLDPNDIIISVGPTNTIVASPFAFFDGADVPRANLNIAALQSSLNHNSVTIQTNAATFGGSGDITILNDLSWTNGNSLVIHALRHVNVNASITSNSRDPHTIQLISDTGNIHVNQSIISNGNGKIDIQANAPLGGDILIAKGGKGNSSPLKIGSNSDVSLFATRDIKLIPGKDEQDFVQVGSLEKGNIQIVAGGTLHLLPAAHIGHGDLKAALPSIQGNISIEAAGLLMEGNQTRIGHCADQAVITQANISVRTTKDAIVLEQGDASIGHMVNQGSIEIDHIQVASAQDILIDGQNTIMAGAFSKNGTVHVAQIEIEADRDFRVAQSASPFTQVGASVKEGKAASVLKISVGRDLDARSFLHITGGNDGANPLQIKVERNALIEADIHSTESLDFQVGGQLQFAGGIIHSNQNCEINADAISLDGPATLISSSSGDLHMTAKEGILLSGEAQIQNETSAGNITLQALSRDIEMRENASIKRKSSGEVLLLANRDILLYDQSSIMGNTLGKITLVADHQAPIAPYYGNGRFVLGPNATIGNSGETHDQLRIYTALQSLNDIQGTLNGQSFKPDTLYEHTSTNRWMTHYPATFVGPLYTVFYKNGNTPPPPDPPPSHHRTEPSSHQLEQAQAANAEMFYKVAWVEDQVTLLPMSLLYDRIYYGKGLSSYTLDFDECIPFIRHFFVEYAEETTPFEYRY